MTCRVGHFVFSFIYLFLVHSYGRDITQLAVCLHVQFTQLCIVSSFFVESKRIVFLVLLNKQIQFLLYIVILKWKWVAFQL